MTDFVKFERDTAPGVATIRLDRPKVNAINDEVLAGVLSVCAELADETEIRAVVLTGGERNFAAGADITAFPDFDREAALAFSRYFNSAASALENLPQRSAAASSWPSPPISGSPPPTPTSACPRSCSASFPAAEAHNA